MPVRKIAPASIPPQQKLVLETVNVTSLKSHPRNVRKHSEENLDAICKSLTAFGQQRPLVVDIHDQVIAGNGTLEAASRLGWTTVQIVRTHLDGAQAEAYAIADNKTTDLSEFDFEALAAVIKDLDGKGLDVSITGFQAYELEPLLQNAWANEAEPPPNEAGDAPSDSHTIKFTKDQWEIVVRAITFAKENPNLKEYDTTSDNAAIAAALYHLLSVPF